MAQRAPVRFRCGPLTVYLRTFEAAKALESFVEALVPRGPVVWFDSARRHAVTGRWSMVGCDPWLMLLARGDRLELRTSAATRRWRAHPLEALRQLLQRYHHPDPLRVSEGASRGILVPFSAVSSGPCATGGRQPFGRIDESAHLGPRLGLAPAARAIGLMGFLGYDLNQWIERLPAPRAPAEAFPDMAWFGMRVSVVVDHLQQRSWLLSVVDPCAPAPRGCVEAIEALERAEERLIAAGVDEQVSASEVSQEARPPDERHRRSPSSVSGDALEASSSQVEFEAMVRRALEHIRAGDIFQANVSQRFTMPWGRDAFSLYKILRRANPSPFACFLSWGGLAVVSCSPERLVRVEGRRVETRPIAGTTPRGATPEEDAVNSLAMLISDKERAEHVMLVDLARNDLGRICAVGSVAVDDFMALEDYSHVIHIISNVTGVLRAGVGPVEVIRALFPGGTITGCPKVRCMEILRALEPVPRGLYTGSLGYIGFDGAMDLNIAIRTIMIGAGRLWFHAGSGIVADSDPAREYGETLAKAGALIDALRAALDRSRATSPLP